MSVGVMKDYKLKPDTCLLWIDEVKGKDKSYIW
jgi:hypothetical protein